MIKKLTLFVLLFTLSAPLFAQDNVAGFPLRFAFRHSDTLRKALPIGSIANTNAFVYNNTRNEFWAYSSHNDSIMRFSVPSGQYLGALTTPNLTRGAAARYMRALTVKDNFFLWGANATDTIRKIDPNTAAEVSRAVLPKWMSLPGSTSFAPRIESIAYDSLRRGFWTLVQSGSRLRLLDSTFQNVIDSFDLTDPSWNTGGVSAIAYDGTTVGGPYLWFSCAVQPDGKEPAPSAFPRRPTMMQVSLTTKRYTGISKTPWDDFDFIINVNQAIRSFSVTRLPNSTKPTMIIHIGKFTSNSSVLLNTDLSGATLGFDINTPYLPDAGIDSIIVTPNYSMVPSLLARPVNVSAKVRNFQAIQGVGGTVRFDQLRPNGTVANTQSVPFNLAASAIQSYQTTATFSGFQKGLNAIRATVVGTNDPVRRNDTTAAMVQITDSTLAVDYVEFRRPQTSSLERSSICFCPGANDVFAEKAMIGQAYKLDWPVTITSVTARISPTKTGDTTRFVINAIDADGKIRFLGQSALTFIRPEDSAAKTLTLPLITPVRVNANQKFMVAITEGIFTTAAYIQVTRAGYTPGSTYFHAVKSYKGWVQTDTLNSNPFYKDYFAYALALRPNFGLRTNTNDPSVFKGVEVAPNPTTGLINLSVDLEQAEEVQVKVMNLNGQVVLNQRFDKTTTLRQSLDLTQQAAGVYLVSLTTAKGSVNRKVVKQ